MSELRTALKDLPPECQIYVNRFITKRPLAPEDLSLSMGYCTMLSDCNACQSSCTTDKAAEAGYGGFKKGFLQSSTSSPSSNPTPDKATTSKSEKSTQSKAANAAKACHGCVDSQGWPSEPLLDGLSMIYQLMARDGVESVTKLMLTMLTCVERNSAISKANPGSSDHAPTALDVMSMSENNVIKSIIQLAAMRERFYASPNEILETVRQSRDMHAIVLFVQDAFGEMFQMDDEQSDDEPSDQSCSIEEGCDHIFEHLENKGYRKTVTMILKCFEILKTLNSSTAMVKAKKDKQRLAIASYLKQRALYDEDPEELYSFSRLHPIWRQLVMSVWNIRCCMEE